MFKMNKIPVGQLADIGFGLTLLVVALFAAIACDNASLPVMLLIALCMVALLAFLVPTYRRIRSELGGHSVEQSVASRRHQPIIKTGNLQDAILNSANFSCIATDAHGVIQIFNVGAERMLGYEASTVLNKITPASISDAQELVARAAALSLEFDTLITPGFEALVFKASRKIEDVYELTYIRKDRSRFPAIVSVTALRNAQDNIIGYLLIGTDNTTRKQFEHRLHEYNVELESAMALAEKANLAKSEFLSSMSHELRTPLNAILGFTQLMASDVPEPNETQKQSIDQILQAGWYLLRLINEILDLSMIESRKVSMSQEAMSLTDVLLDCQAMIEPQAHSRRIQMTFLHLENEFYVHADRTRVKQVLINLLSNAIKYNRPGGGVVVECLALKDARVRVTVKDTGVGLTPEQIKQLFQPFNRLGQESGNEEGTGIGLVVTKQLVELMGGTINVSSTVGVGSMFWVELNASSAPKLNYDGMNEAEIPYQNISPDSASQAHHTVLYVEDNPANLALVEQLLARRKDIKLLTAINAHHGIQLARVYQPNAILMDINLPGISGFGALKILLADPTTRHIPVIALSANAMPRDVEKGMEAGFFRYLIKPIRVDEFMPALNIALEHPHTTGSDHPLNSTVDLDLE